MERFLKNVDLETLRVGQVHILKACNQLHYLHLVSRRAVLERQNELDPTAFRLEPCEGLG